MKQQQKKCKKEETYEFIVKYIVTRKYKIIPSNFTSHREKSEQMSNIDV